MFWGGLMDLEPEAFGCSTMPLISCGRKSLLQTERIRLRSDKGGDTQAVWCANLDPPRRKLLLAGAPTAAT